MAVHAMIPVLRKLKQENIELQGTWATKGDCLKKRNITLVS
jgi:hypothetical protein